MIKSIAKLIIAVNSNTRPLEIGFGIGLGVMLGLMPGGNLSWYLLLLLFLLLRVNIPAMLLSLGIMKIFAPLADQGLHRVGEAILRAPSFSGIFTRLYNMPIIPFSNFNSTTLMGAFLVGLLLLLPIAFLTKILVQRYRDTLLPKIRNSKLMKALGKVPLLSKIIRAVGEISGGQGNL